MGGSSIGGKRSGTATLGGGVAAAVAVEVAGSRLGAVGGGSF